MKVKRIGIDLAKETFGVHGVDGRGRVVVHKCLVGMEACGSAHYLGARDRAAGPHTVRLMSPQFVVPYRKGNKNDPNDATAICEAVTRPSMRFVPIKCEEQHLFLPRFGSIVPRPQ